MKIAYIVRDLNGKGGIQTFAKSSRLSLRDRANVLQIDWHTPHSHLQEILVRVLPTRISTFLYNKWFDQDINSLLEDSQVDAIHFWHIKPAMATLSSLKKRNKPYILTCHGSEILKESIGKYQFERFINTLSLAQFLTTPSNFTKTYLVKEYGIDEKKIAVIHPSISVPKSSVYGSRHLDSKQKLNNKLHIGTLSRLVRRKNIPNIIRALRLLYDDNLEFDYTLVGNGSFLIRIYIILMLRRSKFSWNYIQHMTNKQKLLEFYPSLDVFVLPTLETKNDVEGFGIVYLEANASNVPVIASDSGGVSDAVNERRSGYFADPTSPVDIANKIKKLIEHRRLFVSTTLIWANKFNADTTAENFLKLYNQIKKTK